MTYTRLHLDGDVTALVPLSYVGDLYKMLKRPNLVAKGAEGLLSPLSETKVLLRLPHLVAFLSHAAYEDGSLREPGQVVVTSEGVMWKVTLNDPNVPCRIVIRQLQLDDALAAANRHLASDEAPWEPAPWLKREEKKKRRK